MTTLSWDKQGDRGYQAGLDRGVLYPVDSKGIGVPWNGLVSINETSVGGEAVPYYFDGFKYSNDATSEEYTATLEAFTYPREFDECDGTTFYAGLAFDQQPRKSFNLSYRTKTGNDVDGFGKGYKIHLIFNALAAPSSRSNLAVGATPDPMNFSWALTTRPAYFRGMKPTAHLTIDSLTTNDRLLTELEQILYGTDTTEPRFPTSDELVELFAGVFEIVVDRIDGVSLLIDFENFFDLMGNRNIGIYTRPAESRLKSTPMDGIYSLEA